MAEYIWGANIGQPWFSTLSTHQFSDDSVVVYPNPANDFVVISGIQNESKVSIYTITGSLVLETALSNETRLPLPISSGVYLMKITSYSKTILKKLIVQ